MLVNFTLSDAGVTGRITPVKIIGGQPNFMGEAYNKETYKLMNQLSFNAEIAASGAVSEKL
jgi:poly-gamma-glutamate synthesis protein (capsule biosynthesis protein)